MRRRTVGLYFQLSETEYAHFQRLVDSSGLTKTEYFLQLLRGLEPVSQPPRLFHSVMRELNAIGNNMNQIAHKANATGNIDAHFYHDCYLELKDAIAELNRIVLEPRQRS